MTPDEDQADSGPLFEDRVDPVPVVPLANRSAWKVGFMSGAFGQSPVIAEPHGSTPFESAESQGTVPASPLWAMKYLRHAGIVSSSHDGEFGRIRWSSDDSGGAAGVYVMDDGDDHCMVARLVGAAPDGCTYCLVARISRPDFEDVGAGWAQATDLFSHGRELTLCGVVEGSVSNVIRVARYRSYRDVPPDYLPPSGFIDFDEAL
jgi:hypothetical protein